MDIACDGGFVGNTCHCFYKIFARKIESQNAQSVPYDKMYIWIYEFIQLLLFRYLKNYKKDII